MAQAEAEEIEVFVVSVFANLDVNGKVEENDHTVAFPALCLQIIR